MYIFRDVVFHEQSFPFSSHSSTSIPNLQDSSTLLPSSLTLPPYPISSPPAVVSPHSPPLSPTASSVSFGSLESYAVSIPLLPALLPLGYIQWSLVHRIRLCNRESSQMAELNILSLRALLDVHDVALTEPTCYSNVVEVPEWRQAMQTEFNAFLQN